MFSIYECPSTNSYTYQNFANFLDFFYNSENSIFFACYRYFILHYAQWRYVYAYIGVVHQHLLNVLSIWAIDKWMIDFQNIEYFICLKKYIWLFLREHLVGPLSLQKFGMAEISKRNIQYENTCLDCKSEMSWISWTACSIPSFGPVMVILSAVSFTFGMEICVAVLVSSSCKLVPPRPKIKRWCSFGMLIVELAFV